MPIRLPFEQLLVPVRQSGARVGAASLARHSSAILLLAPQPSAADWSALPHGALLKRLFADKVRKAGDSFHVRVGTQAQTLLVVTCIDAGRTTFERLQAAAKLSRLALEGEPRSMLLWQQGCDPAAADAASRALLAALQAAAFRFASFKSKRKPATRLARIDIGRRGKLPDLEATLASAAGNNLA